MTVFRGEDAIRAFLEDFDEWLSESVTIYLLGGSAMAIRGLTEQTEDIDFAVGVVSEFEHVYQSLQERGFEVVDEPTEAFENVGTTIEFRHSNRGFRIDIFDRQVVGKVWITEQMCERAEEFWSGEHTTAYVLSDEDMFLLKAVSGGDLASGRRRDLEDMRLYAQRGLKYDTILNEIENQRPFNTGTTEAQQIRDRSHPLFAIETAVTSLSGLPRTFTDRVSRFATEFEVEYFVLCSIADDIHEIAIIREQTLANVRSLSDGADDEVDAGIDRVSQKHILERTDGTVRLL